MAEKNESAPAAPGTLSWGQMFKGAGWTAGAAIVAHGVYDGVKAGVNALTRKGVEKTTEQGARTAASFGRSLIGGLFSK